MVLADLGADVIRVDRAAAVGPRAGSAAYDVLGRGRRSVAVDLKAPEGAEVVLRLVERADALLEGFRPGVAERLGIGPDACLARNPRLVYGRMTGWGQDGPLAAGGRPRHQLHRRRRRARPHRPAGRAPHAAAEPGRRLRRRRHAPGARHRRARCSQAQRTGEGQVVDAAMVDGTALLMAPRSSAAGAMGFWNDERGTNLLDSGAPFYDVYRCADGRVRAVGGHRAAVLRRAPRGAGPGPDAAVPDQDDRARWPELRARARGGASRTRDPRRVGWPTPRATDACLAPVLTHGRGGRPPAHRERGTIVEVRRRAPARAGASVLEARPRLSAGPPAVPGEHTDEVLLEAGFTPADVARLRSGGIVA